MPGGDVPEAEHHSHRCEYEDSLDREDECTAADVAGRRSMKRVRGSPRLLSLSHSCSALSAFWLKLKLILLNTARMHNRLVTASLVQVAGCAMALHRPGPCLPRLSPLGPGIVDMPHCTTPDGKLRVAVGTQGVAGPINLVERLSLPRSAAYASQATASSSTASLASYQGSGSSAQLVGRCPQHSLLRSGLVHSSKTVVAALPAVAAAEGEVAGGPRQTRYYEDASGRIHQRYEF